MLTIYINRMFDLKKFIALIGTDEVLMELFYLHADEAGLEPRFDVYHILEGKEKPTVEELKVMEAMYNKHIKGTSFEAVYETAVENFAVRIAEKNKRRLEALNKKN